MKADLWFKLGIIAADKEFFSEHEDAFSPDFHRKAIFL